MKYSLNNLSILSGEEKWEGETNRRITSPLLTNKSPADQLSTPLPSLICSHLPDFPNLAPHPPMQHDIPYTQKPNPVRGQALVTCRLFQSCAKSVPDILLARQTRPKGEILSRTTTAKSVQERGLTSIPFPRH